MRLLEGDCTKESTWLITIHYQISSSQVKPLATIRSVYHLIGIFGSFFWTNGTALFSTKETEYEPYHFIGIFGC